MLRLILNVTLAGTILLTQNFAFATEPVKPQEASFCASHPNLCSVPIAIGAIGLFVVIPGIMALGDGLSTVITCGDTSMRLDEEQKKDFIGLTRFDRNQASHAFDLTCVNKKSGESVFVPFMRAEDIQRKMLYTRMTSKEKCERMRLDLNQYPEKRSELVALEAVESLSLQEKIYEIVFNEEKTECNQKTLSIARARIKGLIAKGSINPASFFSLFFANNLATDPKTFIPAGSDLLKPISVEQFLAQEKERRESEEEYARRYPEAIARAKILREEAKKMLKAKNLEYY